MIVGFDCNLSERSLREFTQTISRWQSETQRDSRSALRSSTVDLIKSLRKQTAKSPDRVPRKAFRFGQSDPKYLTLKGQLNRRMVKKRFDKADLVFFQPVRQIYKRRKLKNGGIAESWTNQSEAQLIRDARDSYLGKIWNSGLARRTWGWMMWRLFNIPDDGKFRNQKFQISHRHCEAHINEVREPLPDGTISFQSPLKCDITLINRLRYITRALPSHAVAQAIESAKRSITAKINKGLKSRRFGS